MRNFKKWGAYGALFCFFGFVTVVGTIRTTYVDKMYAEHPDLDAHIMILGGKVEADGSASDWLANRVRAGAVLAQKQGKPVWLSGDSGWKRKNEIVAMAEVLESFHLDYIVDGRVGRTIDSCWRAKHVHDIESLIIVTQKFHMARALYLCNKLGIDTYGVVAENGESGLATTYLRDYAASVLAWRDIQFGYTPVYTQ